MEKTTQRKNGPKQAADESMAPATGAQLDAMMRASEVMLKGMTVFSQEVLNFTNDRLRQNMEASETVLRCGDAMRAFGIQVEFARSSTQQYFEEANRLMSLMAQITSESWAPLQNQRPTDQGAAAE